jgi:hypothetical protein
MNFHGFMTVYYKHMKPDRPGEPGVSMQFERMKDLGTTEKRLYPVPLMAAVASWSRFDAL